MDKLFMRLIPYTFCSFLLQANLLAVEVFFSPGTDCENKIVAASNNAKKEIVAAVYAINNSQIITALIAAHKRGVKIRVLTDRVQAAGPSSKVLELVKAGVSIRLHSKNKIEHNKFGVFDNTLAISGSFNWTRPASESNSENCVVMPEENAVTAYRTRFDALWDLNTEEKSKAYLRKIALKKAKSRSISAKAP